VEMVKAIDQDKLTILVHCRYAARARQQQHEQGSLRAVWTAILTVDCAAFAISVAFL